MRGPSRLREADLWFQLHWLAGITAGAVLAIVGLTGGLMSFQMDILEWLNADTTAQLSQDIARLEPPKLVARYRAEHPDHQITSLFWRQDRPYPLMIGYRTPDTTGRRGERALLDPFNGEPMAMPRGQWTFGLIRQIHQRLAAGDAGKLIVGVSTITLVVLSISGLWIRWRRRPRQRWRWVWPRGLGGKLAGEWHAVLGVWAVLAYLVAALTGLWWSFDWYRDSAKAVFASDIPAAHPELAEPVARTDFAQVWARLGPSVADARSVFIRLPDTPTAAVDVHYVAADAPHAYASDELSLHPATGAVLANHRYRDQSAGDQLLASVYALHMGAFFGTPGVVAMMLASFALPVFFVTGWLLYLRRRRMKRRVAAAPGVVADAPAGPDTLLVTYASQSGLAQRIATRTTAALQATGRSVRLRSLGELSPAELARHGQALFVVSTHGEGDAPVAARPFDRRFCGSCTPRFETLDYALLSLGDTAYQDSYCAFGRRLDRTLQERGARALVAPIEVDKADQAAISQWQAMLAGLFGTTMDHAEPALDAWRLAERRILNPDSQGGPTAWLRLTPVDGRSREWQAGDIAEIRPRNPESTVDAWLAAHALDGDAIPHSAHSTRLLADTLADRQLPEAGPPAASDLLDWAQRLAPLGVRDYSIANAPGASVELLVRLADHGEHTGLASGWLVERARPGDIINLRLRANPGFRADPACRAAPAIFIGNGTGLAGLRSHLQSRIQAGQHANWLLFGEREQAVDFYCRDEISAWHATGAIVHLNATFSRDTADGRYVQHALAEHRERLLDWIHRGAYVFVCGSHAGMAPGVTEVLAQQLGAAQFSALSDAGRIRMDVY